MLYCMFLADHCLQNCHLGRLIISFMVRNFVLRRCVSRALKAICDHKTNDNDLPPQITIVNTVIPKLQFTSPNYNCEYSYPHSNAFFLIFP